MSMLLLQKATVRKDLAETAAEADQSPELMCALLAAARVACATRAQTAYALNDRPAAQRWGDLNISLLCTLRLLDSTWRDVNGQVT